MGEESNCNLHLLLVKVKIVSITLENFSAVPINSKHVYNLWCHQFHSRYRPKRNRYICSPKTCIRKFTAGASLVAQWLRIHLPMQGTRVRSLIQEDPTCRGATNPVLHNYWACTLGPPNHSYWAHVPRLLRPACLEPVLRNKRSHRNQKPMHLKEE